MNSASMFQNSVSTSDPRISWKSHADQLRLHRIQKFSVGMFLPDCDPRSPKADGVFSESLRSPAPVLQHFRTELRHFLRHPLLQQMLHGRHAARGDLERSGHTFVYPKRFFGIASLDGIILMIWRSVSAKTLQFTRRRCVIVAGKFSPSRPLDLNGRSTQCSRPARSTTRLLSSAVRRPCSHLTDRALLVIEDLGSSVVDRFPPQLVPQPTLLRSATASHGIRSPTEVSETTGVTVSLSTTSSDLASSHSMAMLSCEGSRPVAEASCSVSSAAPDGLTFKGREHFDFERMQAVDEGRNIHPKPIGARKPAVLPRAARQWWRHSLGRRRLRTRPRARLLPQPESARHYPP